MQSLPLYLGNEEWNILCVSVYVCFKLKVSFASCMWLMYSIGFRLSVKLQPHFALNTNIGSIQRATLVMHVLFLGSEHYCLYPLVPN